MPKTPRQRFQQSPDAVRALQDFADSAVVAHSIDMATLQLQTMYAADTSPTCSLNHYRMQGAQDFIKVWLTLGDQQEPARREPTDTLLDDTIVPLKTRKPK